MPTKGTAVVGTGFIGPIHVEALRRLGRPVVGILGSSPEKSKAAAAELSLPKSYDSYDWLLADAEVNVVHLASPNKFHFEQCKQALAAGKHIVCEKPLALSQSESAELVRLAAATPLVAAVCYNVRYYPLCREARQRIADGRIGKIFHVTGAYLQDWLLFQSDFNWRVLENDGGPLRAVADIGTHWLDLLQSITGLNVERVCADLQTAWPQRRRPMGSAETFQTKAKSERAFAEVDIANEDYASVLFRMEQGAAGCFTVSQVSAGRKNCLRYEIAGSKSSLAWNSESPNQLWIGRRDRVNESLLRDPALLSSAAAGIADYPGGHNEGFPDTFKQLFRAIYTYIDRGNHDEPPDFPTFADGHRQLAICDAILRSHREGKWHTVDTRM